MKEEWTESI